MFYAKSAALPISIFVTLCAPSLVFASHSSLERYGDITQVLLPVAGLASTAYMRDLPGFYQWSASGLMTIASVQVLKHTIHRTRPNGHDQSFPSGHTAAAFWGAGFIQQRYGWTYGIPAYGLAVSTGYSRVQTKNHWTSDVIAGAVIGLAANWLVTKPYRSNLQVLPYFDRDRKEQGIHLNAEIS
jgi:membrane-associated phospholipid phosphatase